MQGESRSSARAEGYVGGRKFTVHDNITRLEPLVGDGDGLGPSGSSRREVVEPRAGGKPTNVKILWKDNAYSDPGLGFVLGRERLVEEGLGVQAVALPNELIKSLVTFGGGFVTAGDDDNHIFGKTNELGGSQIGGEYGMVGDEQLGLGRVELAQQFVHEEGRVDRGGDSPEHVWSPGGDGELDVVGSEENDTVVTDVPVSVHDIGETVGAIQISSRWRLLSVSSSMNHGAVRANGHVGVLIVLGDSYICGNAWNGVIGRDKFPDNWLRRHDDTG